MALPWEETDQYIRSGHRDPEDFEQNSFRTITLSEDEGIKAVIGKLKGENKTTVQSYLFDKAKSWNVEKAKAWFEKHREATVKEHVSAILPFKVLEKIVDKPLRIKGIAMTAGMSRNFNIYTPEELQNFAQKLVSAPVYIEHVAVPNAVGKVTKTEWDGQRLWYEAEIYDDETAEKIRKGLIQHVSVGADYETLDILDGKVPHGLHNAELSLVAVPGIPETNIQVLESLKHEQNVKEAEWDTAYINDLPDSAFAVISKGGTKDEQGKTVPRTLRHLPHHKADGSLDLPHLRNALARLSQTDLTPEERAEAKRHLCAHAKEAGIESEVCSEAEETLTQAQEKSPCEKAKESLMAKIQELEKQVAELKSKQSQANISESLVQKPKEPMIPASEIIKTFEGVLPSPAVERSWGLGPQRMCQDLRRAIWKLKERAA
ncbi:MAG: hypothetical protein QXU45_09745 [Candidatus Bathyarchaeia archaeon]